MTWTDDRILINDTEILRGETILDLGRQNDIWTPDIWIEALRSFHVKRSVEDQATLSVDRNKKFVFWQRYQTSKLQRQIQVQVNATLILASS